MPVPTPPHGSLGALQFGAACRTLATAARRGGLVAPSFRSPPRVVGVHRTVRHREDGPAVVAVAFQGRPANAVLADLIEGVIVSNRLDNAAAIRARSALWDAVAAEAAASSAA
jgi:hypothetical protein